MIPSAGLAALLARRTTHTHTTDIFLPLGWALKRAHLDDGRGDGHCHQGETFVFAHKLANTPADSAGRILHFQLAN